MRTTHTKKKKLFNLTDVTQILKFLSSTQKMHSAKTVEDDNFARLVQFFFF